MAVRFVSVYAEMGLMGNSRWCRLCGAVLERKRFNGRLEDRGIFERRIYCGPECAREGRYREWGWNPDGQPFLRVLSLGAGVQSSTVLLMSAVGELPDLDLAVFADTGWEPRAVYAHLAWLEKVAGLAGIPLVRVSAGNLRDDAKDGFVALPFHMEGAMGRRQCTREYKLRPVREATKRLVRERKVRWVQQWVGISWDEAHRMRDSGVEFIQNWYPLVEARLTREDCVRWLGERGFPEPPRSACVGCPYHSGAEWEQIRRVPEEWAEAVELDRLIRPRAFLHWTKRPLEEAVLVGEGPGFAGECLGMCGV